VLVVSEETGIISIVENGVMQRYLTPESLRDMLWRRLGGSSRRRQPLPSQSE